MELSEPERRLIAQLRKSEQRWPKLRWFAILASGASIVFYTLALWWVYSFAFQDVTDELSATRLGILAMASPVLWICYFISCAWLGITIVHWNGNAKRRLLLRLLSEYEKTDD